ncbi:hypothetical protein O3M35_006774 [Rhynocoris fuscipes]|uniref:Ferrochelatase n=1 Tax=Rhynocoris fuscipes TaxID=488301 RepID=A0AAW1DGB2_9HEMI
MWVLGSCHILKNIHVGPSATRWFSSSNILEATNKKIKTGIMMLNMGGPQSLDQVGDYLLRIMTDRDMIQLPFQSTLGPYIARRRTAEVQKKYGEIGGGSPIYKWTQRQGELLCQKLDNLSPSTAPHKHYIAFRYVSPLTEEAIEEIEKDGVERVVIFSQYPQYSCATTGSSLNAIYSYLSKRNPLPNIKWSVIDRWSSHPLLAKTIADRISTELKQFPLEKQKDVILLFSAHSLPLKAVARGDPYPGEVGATVQLVMQELNFSNPYSLVWQSKVGPLEWLSPYTDDAIKGYVKQGKKNFILVPIAFVNEHIETLHEMDIEYCKDLCHEIGGVENIRRASAPNDHPLFISALADVVTNHLKSDQKVSPKFLLRCPHCTNSRCHASKEWFRQLCAI